MLDLHRAAERGRKTDFKGEMAMWHVDPLTLRLFIAVCEEGSIARAAEREFIAPSAVSKRLADLESLARVGLLSRSQRGVSATSAGEAMLRHARHIMRSHERMQAEMSEYAAGVSGHVRMLANVSSLIEFLPDALSAFLALHPKIRVDVEERVSGEIARGVEEGVADLGICRDTVSLGTLEVLPYRTDRLALVVPSSHPLAHLDKVEFARTLDYDHLALANNASINTLMERIASEAGAAIRYRSYVSTFDAALRFVQAGLAVAILPHEALARQIGTQAGAAKGVSTGLSAAASAGLAVIPLSDPWATRRFVICLRERAALSLSAAKLLEHLLTQRDPRLLDG